MRFNNSKIGRIVALITVALAGAVPGQVTGVVSAAEPTKIEGTWLVAITATNCQTGAALAVFSSLYSFAEGGVLTNLTNGAAPSARTSGLGTWEKTDGHSFKASSMAFLFNTAGIWTGTQRITNTFDIVDDQDRFTGTVTVEIFNTAGTLVATMCATPFGQRLEP